MKEKGNIKREKIFGVIVIIGIVMTSFMLYMYSPLIRYKLRGGNLSDEVPHYQVSLAEENGSNTEKKFATENRLIISKIGVNAEILEGADLKVLDSKEGIWREPATSIPTRGSNMVIAGHRRQFLPPNTTTFYLLPEIVKGEYLVVYWEGEKYDYVVTASYQTRKDDPKIYENTVNTTITLYTCTPLATATERWVVRASRVF